jgi:hypothetical protein
MSAYDHDVIGARAETMGNPSFVDLIAPAPLLRTEVRLACRVHR